jgi:hypothetical protein
MQTVVSCCHACNKLLPEQPGQYTPHGYIVSLLAMRDKGSLFMPPLCSMGDTNSTLHGLIGASLKVE